MLDCIIEQLIYIKIQWERQEHLLRNGECTKEHLKEHLRAIVTWKYNSQHFYRIYNKKKTISKKWSHTIFTSKSYCVTLKYNSQHYTIANTFIVFIQKKNYKQEMINIICILHRNTMVSLIYKKN